MHRDIVLTPKFERAFRKFVARRPLLQQRIEETILKMQEDVFAAELGTHKLKGEFSDFLHALVDTTVELSLRLNHLNSAK
jgi:mRNA-degrading endonuclease YafQ of YafQ-DinJ toxin-antitoxin module